MSSVKSIDFHTQNGEFIRPNSDFRDWVSRDGSSGFKAESGRYHLYISHACPWAHRTVILRALKGLEKAIPVTVVNHFLPVEGWTFVKDGSVAGCEPDPVLNASHLKELYLLSNPNYTGRVTVPVLFDRQTNKIVNNESPEIIRMLNSEFNDFCETDEQRKVKIFLLFFFLLSFFFFLLSFFFYLSSSLFFSLFLHFFFVFSTHLSSFLFGFCPDRPVPRGLEVQD